jgi:hypothetical protein
MIPKDLCERAANAPGFRLQKAASQLQSPSYRTVAEN